MKFGGMHARDHRRDVWKVLRLQRHIRINFYGAANVLLRTVRRVILTKDEFDEFQRPIFGNVDI